MARNERPATRPPAPASPAPAPELVRPFRLDRLPPGGAETFEVVADAAERAAIARLLGALAVDRFRFRGRIEDLGPRGALLEGRLEASLAAPCVVSLRPVPQRIDEPVRRRYLPEGVRETGEFDPEADDDTEPFADRIDLGAIALEAAALAIDPWPRHPEAVLDPRARQDDEPGAARPNPFAALARLRDPGADAD